MQTKDPALSKRVPLKENVKLLTFFVGNDEYAFFRGTKPSVSLKANNKDGAKSGDRSSIHRVILHDPVDGKPLLVLDLIADQYSAAHWDDKNVRIAGAVRCYLQADGHLVLGIEADWQGISKFYFAREGSDGEKDRRYVFNITSDTGRSGLNCDDMSPLERALLGTQLNSLQFTSSIAGQTFLSELCTKLSDDAISRCSVRAPALQIWCGGGRNDAVADIPYYLSFRTDIPPHDNCQTPGYDEFLIPAFEGSAQGADAVSKVAVKTSTHWILVQRQFRDYISTKADAQRGGVWRLSFTGVSPRVVSDGPLLRFTQCARSYHDAVTKVSSALSVSFVPLLTNLQGPDWSVHYHVFDASLKRDYKKDDVEIKPGATPGPASPNGKIFVHPVALAPSGASTVVADFPNCRDTGGRSLAASLDLVVPSDEQIDRLKGLIISVSNPVSLSTAATVRMGALDVAFRQGKPNASASEPAGPCQGQSPQEQSKATSWWALHCSNESIVVDVDARIYVDQILPGGQDDVPGEHFIPPNGMVSISQCPDSSAEVADAYVESRFARTGPLVIPVGPPEAKPSEPPFLLRVREQVAPKALRTLRFDLENISGSAGRLAAQNVAKLPKNRVVVLDSDPFLIAQVEYPSLTSTAQRTGSLVAQWTNSDTEGAAWQVRTESEPFQLTLPPQAMGEAMVKDNKFTLPADFRLGLPAHLYLDNSDFLQRFGEVPWNLRRLLGYPGQRDPGSKLRRVEYELIYGLSCNATLPLARIAEVAALAGALPNRMPPMLRSGRQRAEDLQTYDRARMQWADDYSLMRSRVAVLEPWDVATEGSLLMKDVSCEIRWRGKTSHPPADLADPINPEAGLRGGVTWGFESQNVFQAVLKDVSSSEASASDLYFSSLGGWGHQEASFDEGRTRVFADVAMGRTYFYKLERIGRIGVWWNRAKHVIIYERTVVPSQQFYLEQDQNETYGVPLVRKVEEYVEILDEERRYPDDTVVNQPAPASADSQRLAERRVGFVSACVFPKGTRIKVSSAWGTDVGQTGWKVPLWKKDATLQDVYPFPKVSLAMSSQFGEANPEVPCDIADPENLYFYTDTQPGTGPDPDKWAPIAGVDFVDMPRPVRADDFSGGDTRQFVPADASIAGGFDICTFHLKPALRPANITANRAEKAIAVALDNVTLMRARFRDSQEQVKGDYAKFVHLKDDLAAGWRKTFEAAAALNFDLQQLGTAVDAHFDVWFADFLNHYAEIKTTINQSAGTVKKQISDYESAAIEKLNNQIRFGVSVVNDSAKDVRLGTEKILKDVAIAIAQAGANPPSNVLKQIVLTHFTALQDQILQVSASPGLLGSTFRPFVEPVQKIKAILAGSGSQTSAVDALLQIINSASSIAQVRQQLIEKITQLEADIESLWRETASVRLQPWLPKFIEVRAWFGIGHLDTVLGELRKQSPDVNRIKAELQGAKTDALQALQGLETKTKDYLSDFIHNCSALCDANLPNQTCTAWASQAWKSLNDAASQGAAAVDKKFNDLLNFSTASANSLFKQVDALKTSIDAQRSSLEALVVTQIQTPAAGLEEVTKEKVKAALAQLPSSVPEEVRQLFERLRDKTAEAVNQFIGSVVDRVRDEAAQLAAEARPILSLVRAFGQPPNVPGLSFLRDRIAYFFNDLPQVDITPSLGNLLEPNSLVRGLNALNISLPTIGLGDKLVPPDLRNFDLSDIFPHFAGIDLRGLFSNLKLSEAANNNVRITHGADPQSRSAWAQADITEEVTDTPIFDRGPLSLRLSSATFRGNVRVEGGLGKPARRTASGVITGNWRFLVSHQDVVTLRQTELTFDDAGGIRFNVNPRNVELPGVLAFLTNYLSQFGGSDSGLSVGLKGTLLEAVLNLPIPDVQGATTGLANLRLGASFGVGLEGSKFLLTAGFNLSKRDKPFTLTLFILGGAGHINIATRYIPGSDNPPSVAVAMAIMASASLAISLGPISGGVYVYFGIDASYDSNAGGGLRVGIVLLIRGQVNILGIVSASVALMLQATYESGQLVGRGRFSIEIKICWCFTLHVNTEVTYRVGGGGGTRSGRLESSGPVYASLGGGPFAGYSDMDALPPPPADCEQYISDFVELTQEGI